MSSRNRKPIFLGILLITNLILSSCGGSSSGSLPQPGPSQGSAPPGTASSISKDGITWTFSQSLPVGQFVHGDYYVVGPVTITAIDPAPTTVSPYENGCREPAHTQREEWL